MLPGIEDILQLEQQHFLLSNLQQNNAVFREFFTPSQQEAGPGHSPHLHNGVGGLHMP